MTTPSPNLVYDPATRAWAVGDKTPLCVGRFRGFSARYLGALFDDGDEAWHVLPPRGKLPPFPVGVEAVARPDERLLCTSAWHRRDRTNKQAAAIDLFTGVPEMDTPGGDKSVRLQINKYFVCGTLTREQMRGRRR
jgi:hypothetical protein